MNRSKPEVGLPFHRSFPFLHHHVTASTFPCVIGLKHQLNSVVCWLIPAKALEILSFFHSQGWSYSSGGRSSSCGSLLSLGQRERSGSTSPPFSAGSYGVSYRGSCLADPSFGPLPVPPDRISRKKKISRKDSLLAGIQPFVGLRLYLLQNVLLSTQTGRSPFLSFPSPPQPLFISVVSSLTLSSWAT